MQLGIIIFFFIWKKGRKRSQICHKKEREREKQREKQRGKQREKQREKQKEKQRETKKLHGGLHDMTWHESGYLR